MEDPSEARSAIEAGCARLQTIITQRKQGDFGASDSDQCVFPHACTLEPVQLQSCIRDRDQMLDPDLVLFELDLVHDQAQNFLLGLKTRIVQRGLDASCELFERSKQRLLLLLLFNLCAKRLLASLLAGYLLGDSRAALFENLQIENAGLKGVDQSLFFSLERLELSSEPLLLLPRRRFINRLRAQLILLDEQLRVAQQFAHRAPDQTFNRLGADRPIRTGFGADPQSILARALVAAAAMAAHAIHPHPAAAAHEQPTQQVFVPFVVARRALTIHA